MRVGMPKKYKNKTKLNINKLTEQQQQQEKKKTQKLFAKVQKQHKSQAT